MPLGGVGPVAWYDSCSVANGCRGLWPPYLCASGLLSSLLMAWRAHGNEHRQGFLWTGEWGVYAVCCTCRKNALGVFAASLGTQKDMSRERHSSCCTCAITRRVNETALFQTPQLSCWLHNPILFFMTLNRLDCLIDM